jgi:NAD(P)H-dependent FMN reductase
MSVAKCAAAAQHGIKRCMNIIGVSGSLRRESTNSRLIQAAAKIGEGFLEISSTDLIGQLPLFTPDLPADQIAVVREWTRSIKEADGLIISTPEYARGYPGALKNAFDWLVQGDGFVEKPFMFLIASERAEHSHRTLSVVLKTMSGIYVSEADATIPLLGTNHTISEIVSDPHFSSTIEKSLRTFSEKVEAL